MIRRLVTAWCWARVLQLSRVGDLNGSLSKLRRIQKFRPLKHFEQVMEASLLLRMQDYAVAERSFEAIAAATATETAPNRRYSHLYAVSRLMDMNGDAEGRERARAEAMLTPCDGALRRWLPI